MLKENPNENLSAERAQCGQWPLYQTARHQGMREDNAFRRDLGLSWGRITGQLLRMPGCLACQVLLCSDLFQNKSESLVGKWQCLETVIFSEINQTHQLKDHTNSHTRETQLINKEQNQRQIIGSRQMEMDLSQIKRGSRDKEEKKSSEGNKRNEKRN